MLTRLEVQGFKNLLDVTVDFGPFTCVAGTNSVGKSNLFDAIEFLSDLATDSIGEAAQRVRSSTTGKGADARDLFWDGYRDHERRIRLCAEMLVPQEVEDDLGEPAEPATTFLRYEVTLGYEPPAAAEGSIGRLTLLGESLVHITWGDAASHLRFPHSATKFRDAVVIGKRRGGPFLSTEYRDNGTAILVHGDGGSHGKPQPRAAGRAGRTVLSTVTTKDYPTILAARREMQSWRRLALEPSALRAPDGFTDPRVLSSDGRHLAATLHRIANETKDTDPDAVYARVSGRLADLSGVSVESLTVDVDQVRAAFTVMLEEKGSLRLPARALSEGTLRFLALCVLLEDPTFTGLVCTEEPENGIHPANLPAMVQLVRDLAVDPEESPGDGNPLRQVIINTHSPGVVQLCDPADLLLADVKAQRAPDGSIARAMSLRPYRGTWRAKDSESGPSFSQADVVPYLVGPKDAQLQLPLELAG